MILSENSGKRDCTNLPPFWSSVQNTGYRPQIHFQSRPRIVTRRSRYNKEKGEKRRGGAEALETQVELPTWNLIEPHLVCSLVQKKILKEAWADLKFHLGASLSVPPSTIWQCLLIPLFFSHWFQKQLAFLQANAGRGAEWRGHWGGKALVACAAHAKEIVTPSPSYGGRWERGGCAPGSWIRGGSSKPGMECEIKPPDSNTLRNGWEL